MVCLGFNLLRLLMVVMIVVSCVVWNLCFDLTLSDNSMEVILFRG